MKSVYQTNPQSLAGAGASSKSAPRHTCHIECPACIEANLELLKFDSDFSRLLFREASALYLELRKQSHKLKPGTHSTDAQYGEMLGRFFNELRLCDITPGHIRSYQLSRPENTGEVWGGKAGNSIVNHEISYLSRVLKHAKLWAKIQPYYFPLPLDAWSPREILSEDDELDFFSHAASTPGAQLAYWIACITNNTSAVGCELRGLRLRHVYLRGADEISEIYIPPEAVKNISRPRTISLNRTARWAVEQCYKRAIKLGSCEAEHYLFPFREKRGVYDPRRPAGKTFHRKSWAKLRSATGQAKVTPYTFRHQFLTRLIENDVNPETIREIAGHRPNSKMLAWYSHTRKRVKYEAVMAVELDKLKRDRQEPRETEIAIPGPVKSRRSA